MNLTILLRQRAAAFGFALSVLLLAAGVTRAQTPPAPDHAQAMARGLEIFKSDVSKLLVDHCARCHGGASGTKGGLDLSTRESLLQGGSEGPVVVPGNCAASRLIKLVRHDEKPFMPAKGEPLKAEEIAKIAAWIDAGAPYDKPLLNKPDGRRPPGRVTDEDRKFWSFTPLKRIEADSVAVKNAGWCRRPIDRFVLAKLEEKGLAPTAPADKRRLIRRAYFDLLGLPPAPAEVETFVADPDPQAWDKLIDKLLASPHYGERWGRHWLDLARFAESHGYEQDYDRPNAYHYRDFVVRALNDDMPYDKFVKWQIAGDELATGNPEAMKATGYLGAGTHATQITTSQAEKERYDELDDMGATIGTSMLGLTIGCARCHDHKFDPITSQDYYRFISTFTTTVRSDLDIDTSNAQTISAKAEWEKKHTPLVDAVAKYEREQLPTKVEAWAAGAPKLPESKWLLLDADELKSAGGATLARQADGSYLASGANPDFDAYTFVTHTDARNVTAVRIEALAHPSFPAGGPGRAPNGNIDLTNFVVVAKPRSGGQEAALKLVNPKATFEQGAHLAVALAIDSDKKSGWALDPQFGKDHAAVFEFEQPVGFEGGTVFTFTLDHQGNNHHNIGRLRMSITTAPKPVGLEGANSSALAASVNSILSMPAAQRTDADRKVLLDYFRTIDPELQQLKSTVQQSLAQMPKPQMSKAMVCSEGVPAIRLHTQGPDFYDKTFILNRGDLNQKVGEATPSFPVILMGDGEQAERRWQSPPPPGAKTSFRRAGLANWITDVDQGGGHLLARVIVNRLWQHHMGRGIVATPSDFGAQGERPTHPELLDWLASELVRNGWKLKPIHKLMMTSSAYLQDSAWNAPAAAADPENRLLWHFQTRRLEAEAIRDTMLSIGGVLDETMFGPGTLDESMRRRSIYFTIKRSQLIPTLSLFDAPDTLTSLGNRSSTTVAPQALAMMNNPQVLAFSKGFAKRLAPEAAKSTEDAVRTGYMIALSRQPNDEELKESSQFIREQMESYKATGKGDSAELALGDFCQAMMSLNELVFVQ